MKTTIIILLFSLIFSFSFGEDRVQGNLVIGKILPRQESTEDKALDLETKPARPAKKPFPPHWGKPPALQTKDIRPLPFNFGMGSSTLAQWIMRNVKADKDGSKEIPKRPVPSEKIKEKLALIALTKNDLDTERKLLLEELKGKSKKEASELIKEFKDSQRVRHEQIKVARKELAKEVRNKIQTKDRRE